MNVQNHFPYYQKLIISRSSLIVTGSQTQDLGIFNNVPKDVILAIFRQLNELDLLETANVCHTFCLLSIESLKPRIEKLGVLYERSIDGILSNLMVTTFIYLNGSTTSRPATEEEKSNVRRGYLKEGCRKPRLGYTFAVCPQDFLPTPGRERNKYLEYLNAIKEANKGYLELFPTKEEQTEKIKDLFKEEQTKEIKEIFDNIIKSQMEFTPVITSFQLNLDKTLLLHKPIEFPTLRLEDLEKIIQKPATTHSNPSIFQTVKKFFGF